MGGYCLLLWRTLPPLRGEPASLLVLPITAIAGVVAFLLYPVLSHRPSRSSPLLALYGGFLIAMLVYGLYLWWVIPDGTAGMMVLALVAGHLYGAPVFGAVVLASSMLNRVLFQPTGDSPG